MKKVTRYCCPVCGKNNWNEQICPEHYEIWKDLKEKEDAEWLERCSKLPPFIGGFNYAVNEIEISFTPGVCK